MMRKDLDIVLITYNRAEIGLRRTLESLLSDESPVKGCAITILDNASTDATQSICEESARLNENVTYKRNRFNCGIAGNIIKAMELVSKKWLWVVCDDDEFDWSAWPEIDTALDGDYDVVHASFNEGKRSKDRSFLINEEGFIPACIFNTKNIDSTVISNAYLMAYTLFPHLAIGCKVLNNNGSIFVPERRCVLQHYDNDKLNYVRASREGVFHRLNDFQILAGYASAYGLIEDKKLRKKAVGNLCLGYPFSAAARWFVHANPRHNLFNVYDFLASCQGSQVLTFLYNVAFVGEVRVLYLAICTILVWPFGIVRRLASLLKNLIRGMAHR